MHMTSAPLVSLAMPSGDFTFYSRARYFQELTRAIDATPPGSRVLLTSMTFVPEEPLVAAILHSLQSAAQRGVYVHFAIDAHQLMLRHTRRPGPLWFHASLPGRIPHAFRLITQSLTSLRAAGVHVGVTNQPGRRFTSPFAGRSHIKTAIVNDTVFLGGCNLSSAEQLDAMVSWRDNATADWLYDHMKQVIETEQTRLALGTTDLIHPVDTQSELLLDVGVPQQSVIFEHALQVIEQAQKWVVITCQYFPNSNTAQALKRAHDRGVQVYPLFNHPAQHTWPNSILQRLVIARERTRMPAAFFSGQLPHSLPFLHAKLLASEQEAMIGSHNYVRAGVSFGTAEIALHVRKADFAHDLARFAIALTSRQQYPGLATLFS